MKLPLILTILVALIGISAAVAIVMLGGEEDSDTSNNDVVVVDTPDTDDSENNNDSDSSGSDQPLPTEPDINEPIEKNAEFYDPSFAALEGQRLNAEFDGLAEAVYIGNNTWEYLVVVPKPTPCHDTASRVLVAESFPEQVTVEVDIVAPGGDEICIQVVDEETIQGTYQASEGASFDVRFM